MKRYNVTLDDLTVEVMKGLARGKLSKKILSEGIRKAAKIIMQGKVV